MTSVGYLKSLLETEKKVKEKEIYSGLSKEEADETYAELIKAGKKPSSPRKDGKMAACDPDECWFVEVSQE
jgi:hypothetical protein